MHGHSVYLRQLHVTKPEEVRDAGSRCASQSSSTVHIGSATCCQDGMDVRCCCGQCQAQAVWIEILCLQQTAVDRVRTRLSGFCFGRPGSGASSKLMWQRLDHAAIRACAQQNAAEQC